MRILIVDQCSSAKKSSNRNNPLNKEAVDGASRETLINRDGVESYPAGDLYQGRQQQRITEAEKLLEDAGDDVDRVFISAGFGVVDEEDELPLYDVTFSDMGSDEVAERADRLGIQGDLHDLIVGGNYDVVFFALGNEYYRSANLTEIVPDVSDETLLVFFNRENFEEKYDNGLSIPAGNTQAKAYGTIALALKGEFLQNFASHRAAGGQVGDMDDIEAYCKEEADPQVNLDDY
jgi:hypothetical protein